MNTQAVDSAATRTGATPPDLKTRIAQLAALIGSEIIGTGVRAALKRWAPSQPIPLTFFRLWLRHIDGDLPSEHATRAWMLLSWGLALMGRGAHRPGRPLGQALAESGYSEARLECLLDAPEDVLPDLFMGAVRFLASRNEAFDWLDAARLLLAREPDARESIRRNVATHYYRHLSKE